MKLFGREIKLNITKVPISTNKKVREFSKKVIVAMTALWFSGAAFGGVIVWRNGYGLEALLEYIGAPMVGGIIGYMAKAALENREKIKKDSAKGEEHP